MVLFGGLIGVAFGAEQVRFEPTAGVTRAQQRVQVARNISKINSSGAKTLQVKSKSVT